MKHILFVFYSFNQLMKHLILNIILLINLLLYFNKLHILLTTLLFILTFIFN